MAILGIAFPFCTLFGMSKFGILEFGTLESHAVGIVYPPLSVLYFPFVVPFIFCSIYVFVFQIFSISFVIFSHYSLIYALLISHYFMVFNPSLVHGSDRNSEIPSYNNSILDILNI